MDKHERRTGPTGQLENATPLRLRYTGRTHCTVEPIRPGDWDDPTRSSSRPEFGRISDVTRLFGLKRGTLYNLLADGKIKGVLLRVRGQKSGIRLIDLESVAELIRGQMLAAERGAKQ